MGNSIVELTGFDVLAGDKNQNQLFGKRYDTKFLFPLAMISEALKRAVKDYFVIAINTKKIQHYESLYFDTEDFNFYMDHQNGKLGRFKTRLRKYNGAESTYIEVKFRNNKLQTKKWRLEVKISNCNNITNGMYRFVKKHIGDGWGVLYPKLTVNYERITLIPKKGGTERITIDFDLFYSFGEKMVDFHTISIAEIKQKKMSYNSIFFKIMKSLKIAPIRFSKYCFGVNSLYPQLKCNRFKPRHLKFERISDMSNISKENSRSINE